MKLSFFCETTSKLLVFATNGKVFTLEAAKLPGGRGAGEPIRLMIDLEQDADIIAVMPVRGGRKFLFASREAKGFIVGEDEVIALTRKGKQVMNVDAPDEVLRIIAIEGDTLATIGENRKLLIFPLAQVPEMARGKGVRLQRFKEGGLVDVRSFLLETGLTWTDTSGRIWTVKKDDLTEWLGNRAEAGRLPPKGFPRNNRFG